MANKAVKVTDRIRALGDCWVILCLSTLATRQHCDYDDQMEECRMIS